MRLSRILLTALATSLVVIPLSAQEVHFGLQGALSLPSGDLSDNAELGFQLGGHARWAFREGNGLIVRADWTTYGEKYGVTTTSTDLAADYTYHFSRTQRGLYVLAGLSAQDYHQDFQDYGVDTSGLGLDLGVGYDLDRHLGLQARMTSHASMTALNLGVTYTF